MPADLLQSDAFAEVQLWLRSVDGGDLHLGWMPGTSRWEAVLADHPQQRVWVGEGDEPHDAIAQALDLWHVGHPGAAIVECNACERPVYSRGVRSADSKTTVCPTCTAALGAQSEPAQRQKEGRSDV